jgi:hypothetical protein
MATEPKSNLALATDPSKINPYGAPEEQLNEYQQSLKDQIKALEQRYANPNWFKVAAGFLKPQLGGFAASLGSAGEALGENVEQQRAAALPIAQMRAQLAQSNILTGQNKAQADKFAAWKASGKPMDQATYSEIAGLNPDSSVAKAAQAAYEGQRKDLEFTSGQQRLMMDAIQMKQAKGIPLTKAEQSFLTNLPEQLSLRQEAKPLLPGGAPVGAEGPPIAPPTPTASSTSSPPAPTVDPAVKRRIESDIQALTREIERLPAGDKRLVILNEEMRKLKESAQGQGETTASSSTTPKKEEEIKPYTPTFKFPDTSNMSDPERRSAEAIYNRNVEKAEAASEDQFLKWKSLASDPVYSSTDSEYKSAIDLIKGDPQTAKKVFNLLRGEGSFVNQIFAAAQAGFGVNFNNYAANINLPVEPFLRAGLNPEQQMTADRLVRAMLVVGNAKLMSQGITPEKGNAIYQQALENTKASLQQNAATALHNLEKDYITFQQNKKLYDQTVKEHGVQVLNSMTPYTDVINKSPEIKRISEEARQQMTEREKEYKDALDRAKKRRASAGG